MKFRESVAVCMRKFADFNGRARRSEFWWFVLFIQILSFALIAIPYGVVIAALIAESAGSSGGDVEFTPAMGVGIVLFLLGMLASLVLTLPYLAAQSRRLHDTGQSAHWLWFHLAGLGIVPLIMCMMEGQPYANQWGADPKAAERWNAGYSTYPPQAAAPTPYPQQAAAPTPWQGQVPPPPPAGQPLNPASQDPFAAPPQDPFATPQQ